MKLNIQLFAASGSISCSQVGDYNVANNTTVERITFTVKRTSGTTYWAQAKTVTFVVNGQTYTSSLALPSSQTTSSCYVDVTIPHDADGSKYLEYSASIVTGTSAGTISVSGNKWLTRIPRAISLTLSNANPTVGDILRITLNKSSTNFTGSLSYKPPNSDTYYSLTQSTTDYYDWTLPQSLLQYFTDSPSGTFTIRCDTYNGPEASDGSNYIGTSYASFTLNLRSETDAPNYDLTVSESNNIVSNLAIGSYVQNKSKIKISLTNISLCQNSSLSELVVLVQDDSNKAVWSKSYAVTENTNSLIVETDVLNLIGTYKVRTLLYDKRHASSIQNKYNNVNFIAYEPPKITSVSAVRSTSSGVESESGTYLKYVFQASITSLNNKNTKKYEIGYKTTGSSSYTYKTVSTSTYNLNSSGVLAGVTLNANYVYDIRFRVTDAFGEVSIDRELGADFKLMNFNASGKSLAFGTISNRGSNEKYIDSELTFNCMNGLELDGTDINDVITNKVTNAIKKISSCILLARMDDNFTITVSSWIKKKLPLNYAYVNNGNNYLSVSGNDIVVGNGVSVVEISAQVVFKANAYEAYELHVFKNGNESGIVSFYYNISSANTLSIVSSLLQVQQGDVISLQFVSSATGDYEFYNSNTRKNNFLYIKVIK